MLSEIFLEISWTRLCTDNFTKLVAEAIPTLLIFLTTYQCEMKFSSM